MKNIKLFASTELMGAIAISTLTRKEMREFAENPHGMVASAIGEDVYTLSIQVVENTPDMVHLALPYYGALDKLKAEEVSDKDLDAIVGGEILSTAAGTIMGQKQAERKRNGTK